MGKRPEPRLRIDALTREWRNGEAGGGRDSEPCEPRGTPPPGRRCVLGGPPLGPFGEDITWPDQVAPRGGKASSSRKIKPQTSNHVLFCLPCHLLQACRLPVAFLSPSCRTKTPCCSPVALLSLSCRFLLLLPCRFPVAASPVALLSSSFCFPVAYPVAMSCFLLLLCRLPVATLSPPCCPPVALLLQLSCRLLVACLSLPVAFLPLSCRFPDVFLSPPCRLPVATLSPSCRALPHFTVACLAWPKSNPFPGNTGEPMYPWSPSFPCPLPFRPTAPCPLLPTPWSRACPCPFLWSSSCPALFRCVPCPLCSPLPPSTCPAPLPCVALPVCPLCPLQLSCSPPRWPRRPSAAALLCSACPPSIRTPPLNCPLCSPPDLCSPPCCPDPVLPDPISNR